MVEAGTITLDDYGPVVIDLPQAVDASANNHAKTMLVRDVNNMTNYYGQFAPQLLGRLYAEELWEIYEDGSLHPDTQLGGGFQASTDQADVDSVMLEIKAVMAEEEKRRAQAREADEHE